MKNRRKMIEITLICLSGLITIGLSVNSILDNNKKELKLKQKQDSLYNAQLELNRKSEIINQKSETIIKLQEDLRKTAEQQVESLSRLNNPIPEEFYLNLFAYIKTTKEEFSIISKIAKSNGNLLPINNSDTAVEKIEMLKNAQIIIEIVFKQKEREMTLRYYQTPILFMGFNTDQRNGVFTLAAAQGKVDLNVTNLRTADISTNYSSPSMMDFKNCTINVNISFGHPELYKVGEKFIPLYLIPSQSKISLSIDVISLRSKRQEIEIRSLSELGNNKFVGKSNK